MKREHLFAGFFFTVLLYLLYQFYLVIRVFLGPLSWAALLALVFYPAYRRVNTVLRGRHNLAAFLFTMGVILAVIVPGIFVVQRVTVESVAVVQKVRQAHESGELGEALERVRRSAVGRVWNEQVAPRIKRWNIDLPAVLLKLSNAASRFMVSQMGEIAANIARFFVSFCFGIFSLFFFFRDGERMVASVRDLLPMEDTHKDAILQRLYDTLSAVVQGTLATAIAQGVLAGIGFWIVGVPFAVLLGCATAFLSLVPMIGPLIWMGVVAYLAIIGQYVQAAVLTVWCVLLVSSADNVLRPLIIGGRTQIPTIFLFFGILGGMQVYGFLGIFLGPALIAILVAFLQIYRDQYAAPGPQTVPETAGVPRSDAAPES